jgi:transcriptional regulator with XRE-family HTH domain
MSSRRPCAHTERDVPKYYRFGSESARQNNQYLSLSVWKRTMSVFGKRLKEARLEAKLSQEQLGLLAGLEVESASARMNRYERGTRVPGVELVERIGRVLNLPITYFYSVDDKEATLVTAFHRMTEAERIELLSKILRNER